MSTTRKPVMPVGGNRYNIGYDAQWQQWNPNKAQHNSDFYSGAGDANHPTGHEGVDVFGPEGAPMRAPLSGRILEVGNSSISGNYVKMKSGDREFFFAHLDAHAKGLKAGDDVRAGEKIGTLGDTGQASGTAPHLHFQMKVNGQIVDPGDFLIDAHRNGQRDLRDRRAAKMTGRDESPRNPEGPKQPWAALLDFSATFLENLDEAIERLKIG